MEEKLTITYHRYSTLDQMDAQDRELVEASVKAAGGSYSPYSHFRVGAALRLADGRIVTGANQENAAFPSGLCAERTAMFHAGAVYTGVPQVSLAITGMYADGTIPSDPATPCGACRQVMAEYQKAGGRPMSVILNGNGCILKFDKVDDLLPFIFDSI